MPQKQGRPGGRPHRAATRAKPGRKRPAAGTRRPRAIDAQASRIQPIVHLGLIWAQRGLERPVEFRVSFARPDDLLVCDFLFDNLRLAGGQLVRKDPARSATLVVELPPQSFGERAFLDATGPEVAA